MADGKPVRRNPLKEKIHEIIFEADTPTGRLFDIILIILIIGSILTVMMETVDTLEAKYGRLFYILEWIFTIFFTLEYILRLYSVYRPMKYATSFFGIIDLLAIIPTYLSLLISGSHYFLVIRALRLLRIFRIFKLGKFLRDGDLIRQAMLASRGKITVFLTFIVLAVIIIGSLMYLVEGEKNESFSSIPISIYWAIVTITTVGYGDIAPQTALGQFLSALIMILGYAVLAVPTGIVSAEFVSASSVQHNTQACRYCGKEGHDDDAIHCKYCGELLNENEISSSSPDSTSGK